MTTVTAFDPITDIRRLDLAAVQSGDPEAMRDRDALVRRGAAPDRAIRDAARATLDAVRAHGDEAVRAENARVGGGSADGRLVLTADEVSDARDRLDPAIRAALEQAIDHVRRFAETQRPTSQRTVIIPGIEIERRWAPLASVGCYVPAARRRIPRRWS